jgi:Tfp pilus assembly protein PilF
MRLKQVVSKSPDLMAACLAASLLACAPKPPQAAPPAPVPDAHERAAPRTKTVREAEARLARGDFQGARDKFEEALAGDPNDARAWLGLGIAHEGLDELTQADGAYRRALQIDPHFAEARNNLGLLMRARGQLKPAIHEFQRALTADPKLASAQTNLALTLEEVGHADEALAAYTRAVALSPHDPLLRANFGLFLLGHGAPERAVSELRAGLADAQGNRAALSAIGSGLRRAKKPDEAIRALNLALEASPGQPTVALLSELALAQNAAGELAAAKQTLTEAIALDALDPTPHYLLGSLAALSGDLKAAKKHWEACVKLDPDGPLAQKARERLASLKQPKRSD